MDPQLLATTPAGKPPDNVQPNFDHPHSTRAALISVASVLLTLTLVFVSARVFTRLKVRGKLSPDDYTCILATIGAVFYYVVVVLAVTVGVFGIHSWDLHLSDLLKTDFLKIGFLCNTPFFIPLLFAKLTFFLLYLQIFKPNKWIRYGSYSGAVFTVIFYGGIVIFNFVCTVPYPGQSWQETTQRKNFNYATDATVGIAAVGLVIDVVILLVPISGVIGLQMSGKRKIGVISVFLTGLIAVIASALSIYYKVRLQRANSADATYDTLPVLTVAIAELCVGIIASCMPAMSSFLRHIPNWAIITSLFSSRSRSRSRLSPQKNADASYGSSDSKSKPKRATYKDLEQWRGKDASAQGYEMGSREVMVTATKNHKGQRFMEDGIRMDRELDQRSQERESEEV